MKRFVRGSASAANSGGASSNDMASGGGGGQSRISRAPEPGDEVGVDLEVSIHISGDTLEAAALPEEVDVNVNGAQLPQTWHLASWCVARAHSVCRRVSRTVAIAYMRNKERQKFAAALHLSLKSGPRGKQWWLAGKTAHENATQKAQAALEALRAR